MAGVTETRFNRYLKENRSELNSVFAAARRRHVGLDPDRFAFILTSLVAPAFDALTIDDHSPASPGTRSGHIGTSLYRAALDLEVHGGISPLMEQTWHHLIPILGKLLVTGKEPLVGAVSNAMVSLEGSRGARADQWLAIMAHVSPIAADAHSWLQAGQVAAWRSGIAAYRTQALDRAALLDDALLAVIFAQERAEVPFDSDHVLDRLRADPWFDPATNKPGASTQQPILVGGFRGFGGPFHRPPIVGTHGTDVVATDGIDYWHILADAFGSAVVRVGPPSTPEPTEAEPPNPDLAKPDLARPGLAKPDPVSPTRSAVDLGAIPEPSSVVTSSLGLVVTSRLSHSIFLLGPVGQ